ncbi:MAG: hypothetical protein KC657_18935 [Myxococcales bacterium]|nr:hypothetical protein [Myxococcales bacterium]
MMPVVSTLAVVVVLAVAATITAFVFSASRRAGLPPRDARAAAIRTAALLGGWLALLSVASLAGGLRDFEARPPRMFFVLGGAVAIFTLASRTRAFGRVLDAMPRSWPVALQGMRVPIELGLWALCGAGRLPAHLTFEGRNFDVLVGLSAPVVAWGLARRNVSDRSLLAWNVLSLGLLANVVGMAITTMPGPLHLAWPGPSNTIVAEWPFVWLPGFLVPVALFGHVTSLRQIARARARRTQASAPTQVAEPSHVDRDGPGHDATSPVR